MHNYRDRLYTLIHMTDNNHFDPIFLFTMIFPAFQSIIVPLFFYYLQLRIQPSVGTKLPAVMGVSLQPSRTRSNHLAHQQFAFSPDFSLMPYTLSGFQFRETFFPDILYSSAMPCTELSLAVKSLQICFLLLFLSAEFPDPLKISPADSISLMRLTLLLRSNFLAGFVHFV